MLGLFKGKNKGTLLHSRDNGKVVPITEFRIRLLRIKY